MTREQLDLLIEYIDKRIAAAIEGEAARYYSAGLRREQASKVLDELINTLRPENV